MRLQRPEAAGVRVRNIRRFSPTVKVQPGDRPGSPKSRSAVLSISMNDNVIGSAMRAPVCLSTPMWHQAPQTDTPLPGGNQGRASIKESLRRLSKPLHPQASRSLARRFLDLLTKATGKKAREAGSLAGFVPYRIVMSMAPTDHMVHRRRRRGGRSGPPNPTPLRNHHSRNPHAARDNRGLECRVVPQTECRSLR